MWPDAKIRPFGSLHTGLFLPTSDIDVLVEDNTLPPDYLERTAKELRLVISEYEDAIDFFCGKVYFSTW